jgi:hypothetical protein
MKGAYKVLAATGIVLSCLCATFFITWLVWHMQIHEKAFHCIDDGLSIGFWESAEAHQRAGDKILPGWTWEKLQMTNRIYLLAFFFLWIAGSILGVRAFTWIFRRGRLFP